MAYLYLPAFDSLLLFICLNHKVTYIRPMQFSCHNEKCFEIRIHCYLLIFSLGAIYNVHILEICNPPSLMYTFLIGKIEFFKNIFSLRSQKYLTFSSNKIILLNVCLRREVENMFIEIYWSHRPQTNNYPIAGWKIRTINKRILCVWWGEGISNSRIWVQGRGFYGRHLMNWMFNIECIAVT